MARSVLGELCEVGVTRARVYEELAGVLERRATPFVRENIEERINPFLIMPKCRSIIAVAVSMESVPAGEEYRIWLRDRLKELDLGKVRVDRGELLERHIAWQAGLGWFGRNNMLFNPRFGNRCFIGLILTERECDEYGEPLESGCDGCLECVRRCPTGALGEFDLDAEKCVGLGCEKCFCLKPTA